MTGDHLQELRDQGKVRPRLMAAHPLAAWSLAAAWAGLCVWLVPHFVAGLDWRWLVWLVVAFVAAAAATYGLLHVGMLRLP